MVSYVLIIVRDGGEEGEKLVERSQGRLLTYLTYQLIDNIMANPWRQGYGS